MREILFRGKDVKGNWHIGLLAHIGNAWYISNKAGISNAYEVIPETIGQYTGLHDCKGKKIFEGDIIRFADYHEYECYLESLKSPKDYEGVSFENLWTVDEIVYGIKIGYPAFDLNHNDFECNGLAELNCSAQYYYEKIGNIHDKPEPLEMQDD